MGLSRRGLLALAGVVAALVFVACSGPGGGSGVGPTEGSYTLTVAVEGPGRVTVEKLDLDCRDSCTVRAGAGVELLLEAKPDAGKAFVEWQGDCSGSGECRVPMDGDADVRALFADNALQLDIEGDGRGRVRVVPPDAECTADCSHAYRSPVTTSMTVTPESGSSVQGWDGACSGTSRYCQLEVNGTVRVTLTLVHPPVAASDSYEARQGEKLVVPASEGVLANDVDTPDDTLTAQLVDGPSVGSLELRSDGSFEYTPSSAASGGDSFTYRARDEFGNTSQTTGVSIDIQSVVTPSHRLSVSVTGTGTVSSSPAGIDCPDDCSHAFDEGTTVTLTATSGPGHTFAGWGGACSGTSATCTLAMNEATGVSATFRPSVFELAYSAEGDGSGTVELVPGGSCNADCALSYEYGDEVELTATAGSDSEFSHWGGACSGSEPVCDLTVTGDLDVSATFERTRRHSLSVVVSGSGTVTSHPAGVDCPDDCSHAFDEGTEVTLTATSDSGHSFDGWGGACTDTSTTCDVTMDQAKSVTATFVAEPPPPQQYLLSVEVSGSGTVNSNPAGITCPNDCAEQYEEGKVVTLSATADSGHTFDGWSGACTDTSTTCDVTMDQAKSVTATFVAEPPPEPERYRLSVSLDGSGAVASTPDGIDCPEQCANDFEDGTSVTLNATPAEDSEFSGWQGSGCGGKNDSCTVQMSQDRQVTAMFETTAEARRLEVAPAPENGTVTSDPDGILCGGDGNDCSHEYASGTEVELSALAADGYEFDSWTGACSASTSRNCSLALSRDESLTANFREQMATLIVSVQGGGAVSSLPEGIEECREADGTCEASYSPGSSIELSARADDDHHFESWTGCDPEDQESCTVVVEDETTVMASFMANADDDDDDDD